MSNADLKNKRCRPCEGDIPPLSYSEAVELTKKLCGWVLKDKQIEREFAFRGFKEALQFVNRVAEIAEDEGHHPDILIHQYNKVRIALFTHAVSGLTENDFIVAAKIDSLF